MPSFDKHCKESIEQFGGSFEEVHKWLDEYAGSAEYGFRHRRKRHHERGIQTVIGLFGEEAGRFARMHIISDLKEEGWKEGDTFPKDEKDLRGNRILLMTLPRPWNTIKTAPNILSLNVTHSSQPKSYLP